MRARFYFSIITASCLTLLVLQITDAFNSDSNVAGYSPFSRIEEDRNIIGLLWTVEEVLYTSRCFDQSISCDDERVMYVHSSTIRDMEIYFDGLGVYISDTLGDVYWINMNSQSPVVEQLNVALSVVEVSVDWLSNRLYFTTNDSQIYRCDRRGEQCLALHAQPLPYQPKSLVADPYNGYLYWLTNNGSLLKHDLSTLLGTNNVSSDIAISSRVFTYSVAFNHYDLYSIYKVNESYSEITLTYLNGLNQKTHIPLNHSMSSSYSELNCFHNQYCMWLDSENGSTHLCWYHESMGRWIIIDDFNLTASSVMKQWHRQVQPIPIAEIPPDYTDIYVSSTSVEVHWNKPNIVEYLLLKSKYVGIWLAQKLGSKYMQSEAAWSNWIYELNITSEDGTSVVYNTTQLSYRIDNLSPNVTHNISILAQNEIKPSGTRDLNFTTLTADPTIYTSTASIISAMDVFGNVSRSWNLMRLNWIVCDMETGEDDFLYVLSVPWSSAVQCYSGQSRILLQLNVSSGEEIIVEKQLSDITAVGYDWIGKMVYVGHQRAIHRMVDLSGAKEQITPTLSDAVSKLVVDPLSAQLYWSSRNRLYTCAIGPFGSCDLNPALASAPPFSSLNGPAIDTFTRSLYWGMVTQRNINLNSMDLTSGARKSTELDFSSNNAMEVAERRLYVIVEGVLRVIDLQTNKQSVYSDINARSIAYRSDTSHPLLPGMNSTSTDYVIPEVDSQSIAAVGDYRNFSIHWTLISQALSSVSVTYNVRITEDVNGRVLFYSENHADTFSPDITSLAPETNITVDIEPYTAWRNGSAVSATVASPAAEPGVPESLSMFTRRDYQAEGDKSVVLYLIIRWQPPSFTGGIIQNYSIRVQPEVECLKPQDLVLRECVVSAVRNTVYSASVRAQTSAGFGNWSIETRYNSSAASPLPLISSKLYSPEFVQIEWSTTFNDSLYNCSILYRELTENGTDYIQPVTSSHHFYAFNKLLPQTRYRFQMRVCSTSFNESLWFAGSVCDYTNAVEALTFMRPWLPRVFSTSDSTISLIWTSPSEGHVVEYHIKYTRLENSVSLSRTMKTTASTPTTSNFNYKITLDNLQSDTEYDIVLVLFYPLYNEYDVPRPAEERLIVRTNQSQPGAVFVSSAECNEETCLIEIDGDIRKNDIKARITCPQFEPLQVEVNSDGTKVIRRSSLPDDISECSITTWSENTVGKSPNSSAVGFSMKEESEADLRLIISVCVIAGIVVVVVISILCYCRRKRVRRRKKAEAELTTQIALVNLSSSPASAEHHAPRPPASPLLSSLYNMTDNALYDTAGMMKLRESVSDDSSLQIYDRNKLMLTKFLGSGAFGEVYEGKARDIVSPDTVTLVAVKTLRADATTAYKEEFVKEAKIMSQFDNDYIVRLLGVCIDRDPYYILIELMNQGDLVAFLRKSRPSRERCGVLTLSQLVSICIDIAAGCKYLEMLHFVHRDLAARNCLVSLNPDNSQYQVKLGDFGLARDIYRNDYYRKEGEALLPVRWMSPEALVDGVFTTQSDIWAFGVLMWEVFSLAMQPYAARSNIEVLRFVTNSGTLDKPVRCPHILFNTMAQCWSYASSDRPPFRELYRRLTVFRTEQMRADVIDEFQQANRRLLSENEFFGQSASSGKGIDDAEAQSPVFSPDIDFEKDSLTEDDDDGNLRSDQPRHFDYSSVSPGAQNIPSSILRSLNLKNLFKKRAPHHLLERVHSSPAEVSSRKKNKYVRSDSTISADGVSAGKRYFEADDRQLSLEDAVLNELAGGTMNAISEEKLSRTLEKKPCTQPVRHRSVSLPKSTDSTVQYSNMAFNIDSSNAQVHNDATAGQSGPEQSIQYSTMTFRADEKERDSAESDTVQYSAMAFSSNTSNGSGETDSSVSSAGDEESVQYSSMLFNKEPEPADPVDDDSVQYSTIAFNANASSHSEEKGDKPGEPRTNVAPQQEEGGSMSPALFSSSLASTSSPVQYSSMAFNTKSASLQRQRKGESPPPLEKRLCSTLPRATTPNILSTPLGTKVIYTSEKFKHSPTSHRKATAHRHNNNNNSNQTL